MTFTLLQDLQDRGYIAQNSHPEFLAQWLQASPGAFYCGYDPTASSLHVGHLLTMMLQRVLLRHGHRCIVLMGGATALIGDPSGKQQMRPMLQPEEVKAHTQGIFGQLQQFHHRYAKQLHMVNNQDWLGQWQHLQLLRHIGPHFSVPRMLKAETYKRRLEEGLTLLELHYQVLQAMDFCHLYEQYQCRLQIGGDDQWSNMLAGIHLGHRLHQAQLFALTVPLLSTSNGEKMGKTAQGAIWLDSQLTPPYAFFQYWRNCQDQDIPRWLALFTSLPMAEIRGLLLSDLHHVTTAKLVLAFEVTLAVHGEQAALQALQGTYAAFGAPKLATDVLPSSTMPREQEGQLDNLPTFAQPRAYWLTHPLLVEVLLAAQAVPSKAAGRRLLEQQAIVLQGEKITDPQYRVPGEQLLEQHMLLRIGKKRWLRLLCEEDT